MDIDDAQTSLALLRACMGTCQVNYLLRKTPPTVKKRGARIFDAVFHDTLNELTGGTLSRDTFQELKLPAGPINDETPTFGLDQTTCDTNGRHSKRGGS